MAVRLDTIDDNSIRLSDILTEGVRRLDSVSEPPKGFLQAATERPFEKLLPGATTNVYLNVMNAVDRLKADQYEQIPQQRGVGFGGVSIKIPSAVTKEKDIRMVEEYTRRLGEEYTFGGRVGQITSEIPRFMVEFWATGGLASMGDDLAREAGKRILGKYVSTTAGKAAIGTGAFATKTAFRSVGLPHRAVDLILERQAPQHIDIKDNGKVEIINPEEGWYTSIWKGLADHYIEIASEQTGEFFAPAMNKMLTKVPFMGKFLTRLGQGWTGKTGKTLGEFYSKVSSKTGFHGVLSEMGEEYVGDISRAILDVDDFGAGEEAGLLERVGAAVKQDTSMLPEMAVAFAIPGAFMNVVVRKQLADLKKNEKFKEALVDIEIEESRNIAQKELDKIWEGDSYAEEYEDYDFKSPGGFVVAGLTPKWLTNRIMGVEGMLQDVVAAKEALMADQQDLNIWINRITHKIKKLKSLKRIPEILPTQKVEAAKPIKQEKTEIDVVYKIDPIYGSKTINVVDTEKKLPPVKKGFVRLYRSESMNVTHADVFDEAAEDIALPEKAKGITGQFYSDSLEKADYYREAYGPESKLFYLDIPKSEAESYFNAAEGDYFVPELTPEQDWFNKLQKKITKNKPLYIMRDLLDTYEEAPKFLTSEEANVFNQIRELTRYMRTRTNMVREKLGLEPIADVKGYITHWMDAAAEQVVNRDLPVHSGYLYHLMQGLPKTIDNKTAKKREIKEDLESYFSKDLGKLLRIMVAYDLRDIHLQQPYQAAWDELNSLRDKQLIPDSVFNEVEKFMKYDIRSEKAYMDRAVNTTLKKPVDFLNKFLPETKKIVDPSRGMFGSLRRLSILNGLGLRLKPPIRNLGQRLLLLDLYRTQDYAKGQAVAIGMREMPIVKHPITGQDIPLLELVRDQDWYRVSMHKFEDTYGAINRLESTPMVLYQKSHIGSRFISNVEVSVFTGYFDWLNMYEQSQDKTSEHYKNCVIQAKKLGVPLESLQTQESDMMWNIREAVRRTQWEYMSISMPGFYRSQFNRAMGQFQGWWMNYFFNHSRECLNQMCTGRNSLGRLLTPYGRLRAFKGFGTIQAMGRVVESVLGIEMLKYLFAPMPTYLPPIPALVVGLLQYFGADDEKERKKALKTLKYSMKFWIPFSAFWRDLNKTLSGEMDISEFLFYKKKED